MQTLKVKRIDKSLLQEFRNELISENSRRFSFILYLVILSQLVFIILELLPVMPWQTTIFYYRLGVIAAGLLFVGVVHTFSKRGQVASNFIGHMLSAIHFICLIIGCYFTVVMFAAGNFSFSAFLLVSFVVSITCAGNPCRFCINFVFFLALTVYLHLAVVPIAGWFGECLIALVFVVLIFIGHILNFNRHINLFLKEKEILRMNRTLTEMSHIDTLTGIYNRRKLADEIDQYIGLFKRYQHSFCLAILDIDFFKEVNDTYGHTAGDDVLCRFSNQIQAMLRSTDVFGRWGGEEFLLILPNCSEDEAYSMIERLRSAIRSTELLPGLCVTFSAGVCGCRKNQAFSSLVSNADRALYTAKNSGRNQTIIYTE